MPPKYQHQCEFCPGGPRSDGSMSRDGVVKVFIDTCIHQNANKMELSRMHQESEWETLKERLRDGNLIDEQDVNKPAFRECPLNDHAAFPKGLDVHSFQKWIRDKMYSEELKNVDEAAETFRRLLHAINAFVQFWGLECLTQREVYTLLVIFEELEQNAHGQVTFGKERIREFRKAIADADLHAIHGEQTETGPIATLPEEFQMTMGPEIEKRLREFRIRAYPVSPEKILEQTEWGYRCLIGTSVESGEEVQVLEFPWEVAMEYENQATLLSYRVEALKQLALSRYFLKYLGNDFASYTGVGLHFLQMEEGISLRDFIFHSGPLDENQALFRHWAKEILLGMRDYLYQCCQELYADITLEHIYCLHEGLQIRFQRVPFGNRRGRLYTEAPDQGPNNKWRNGHVATEYRLITMFGNMCLELLYGQEMHNSPIRTMGELSPLLRSLIFLTCNARDSLDHAEVRGKPQNQPSGAAGSLGQNSKGSSTRKPGVRILPNVDCTADEGDESVHADEDDDTPDQEHEIELRLEVNDASFAELSIQKIVGNPYWHQEANLLEMMKFYDSRYRDYRTKKSQYDKFSKYLDRNVG
eukprot:gnl/MRDRNA2_/MRDRNA2_90539_c0_seq1.p1 gnl/MRDRNA2_/MRDRNA2_90539_c0~~gnl/MRDRNA2_/MRDRNA2_90539_c0_seq1.p1  ORF type:complete len:585 (+),score=110.44 gnl/MRDRNA2_/MRDRNA2_90539_c0_seq1:82-1836(+)